MKWTPILAVVLACAASLATASDNLGLGSGFAMYKARRLAEVQPYDDARRVETYQVIRRLAELSLRPLFNRELGRIDTDLTPEWPQLALIDNDNDLKPDFFVYQGIDAPSEFYGAFFPLGAGGTPGWIVFPVGPVIDENKEFIFLFTHWVDRNADGRADLVIEEGVLAEGAELPRAGSSAWLLDEDFDGGFETALRCVAADCVTVSVEDGRFDLKLFIQPGDESLREAGAPLEDADFLSVLFADLRRAAEGDWQ